ncbi:MAG: EamA family transporter [Desulfobacterales bacterium]
MPAPEWMAVTCGLASAAAWGAGDFSGGLATRRSSVFSVVILSQLFGGVLLTGLALWISGPLPDGRILLLGGLAGIAGGAGLLALYKGLASGRMGVVAPVTAVVAVIVPVVAGALTEGLPPVSRLAGFGVALSAVWLLTRATGAIDLHFSDLGLPLAAGAAFGIFFILIDRVSASGILWPLVAARTASIPLLFLVTRALGRRLTAAPSSFPAILLAGAFDSAGNAFFALATRLGRLDISAVVSSLYPGMTVLLAWLILREHLSPRQWAGVGATLCALVLITR